MNKTKILKNIFSLARNGIYIDVNTLPNSISKEVVRRNILHIELQNLIKSGGSQERINEIKSVLSSPPMEVING